MNEILKQYRKTYRVTLIGTWTVCAVCAAALALTGVFKENPFRAAIIVVALSLLSAFYTADFIVQPLIFKRKISKAGGEIANSLKEKPARFPMRFFFGNVAVFFANRKIKFADCREIVSAELLRRKIRMTLKGGKVLNMPFRADENPAILCAVLRTLNGDIDFVINGKHIDKVAKADKKGQSEDRV